MRLFARLLGLLFLIVPPPAAAETLTLAEAEALALARDTLRAQLVAEAAALDERAVAAGALPDPEVSLGLQNLPAGSFALDADPMTQVMLGIEQRFPAGKGREHARERGRYLAAATEVRAGDRDRQLRFAVRRAWFAADNAIALERLAETVKEDATGLLSAAEARYQTGGGRQSDYLAAGLRLDRLEERAMQAREMQREAMAMLRRWIGVEAFALVPAALPEPMSYESLHAGLDSHPVIQSDDARIAAGQAGEAAAEGALGPNWKMGVSYGYRQGMAMSGEPADDMVSFMVGLSVPLFTKNRQDREISAARSDTRAARFAREDTLRELAGRLDAAWQRHREASRQLELYEQRLLPAARQMVDATLDAYAGNNARLDELVDAHVERFDLEARRLELIERVQLARAEIFYLAGEPQ